MQAEKGFIKLVTDNNYYTITKFGWNGAKELICFPTNVQASDIKSMISDDDILNQVLDSIGYVTKEANHMPNGMFLRNNGWDVLF